MELGAWTIGLFACQWNNPGVPRLLPGPGAVRQPLNIRTLMALSSGNTSPSTASSTMPVLGTMQELIPD